MPAFHVLTSLWWMCSGAASISRVWTFLWQVITPWLQQPEPCLSVHITIPKSSAQRPGWAMCPGKHHDLRNIRSAHLVLVSPRVSEINSIIGGRFSEGPRRSLDSRQLSQFYP